MTGNLVPPEDRVVYGPWRYDEVTGWMIPGYGFLSSTFRYPYRNYVRRRTRWY